MDKLMDYKMIEGIGEMQRIDNSYLGTADIDMFGQKYKISIRFRVNNAEVNDLPEELRKAALKCIEIVTHQTNYLSDEIM